MNSRERFLAACRCEPVDHPPVWVMRQAGRHLPEYMALREEHSFHELVKTPELACEVTMQPVRRYGMDAAIIFSDILVIPEAMGQAYDFRDSGGIEMAFRVSDADDIARLEPGAVRERLDYMAGSLRLVRQELGDQRALIGFGGSPWTLATYMVEGGSSRDYRLAKRMFYEDRETFDALMAKLVEASIEYFRMQVECGVDVIQIFDSWGGVLARDAFWDASARWMADIVSAIDDVPFIVFSKGAHQNADLLSKTGAAVLGIDWTADLAAVRRGLDGIAVQGNLEPVLVETTPEVIRRATRELLDSMAGLDGHVFNLGHGISPHGKIECVEAMIAEIRSGASA